MDPKKRDLEIIYNLQWKNGSANGGDKANIIGMYDIPSTTLNWEVFKSYLLKNSGISEKDVKVSYITSDDREFPIESQKDFQIALYAFRRKARMNEIINLKLDTISTPLKKKSKATKSSNDVETQFSLDNDSSPPNWFLSYMTKFKTDIAQEINTSISAALSNLKVSSSSVPSCHYPRKAKIDSKIRVRKCPVTLEQQTEKDIYRSLKLERKLEHKLEKLEHKSKKHSKKVALCTKSSDSDFGHSPYRSYSKVVKDGYCKGEPSYTKLVDETYCKNEPSNSNNHAEKEDSWYSNEKCKMDSKDLSDFGHSAHRIYKNLVKDGCYREGYKVADETYCKNEPSYRNVNAQRVISDIVNSINKKCRMDAKEVNKHSPIVRMLGGEVYLHKWEVENSGTSPWTSQTYLQFTWGSKLLKPLDHAVLCPPLQPGETGIVAVRLEIPRESGEYECYWHFLHQGRRFGHWLGCQVIVDPFDLKGNDSVLTRQGPSKKFKAETTDIDIINGAPDPYARKEAAKKIMEIPSSYWSIAEAPIKPEYTYNVKNAPMPSTSADQNFISFESKNLGEVVREVSSKLEDIQLQEPTDTNCSSDSDNQSVVSATDSNSSRFDEFVVVAKCSKDQQHTSENILLPIKASELQKAEDEPAVEDVQQSNCYRIDSCELFVDWPKLPPPGTTVDEDIGSTANGGGDVVVEVEVEPVANVEEEEVEKAQELRENFDDNNNTEQTRNSSRHSSTGSIVKVETSDGESDRGKNDMVLVSMVDDEHVDLDYATIVVDGQKIQIPKRMIKSEYLEENQLKSATNSSASSSVVMLANEEKMEKSEPVNIASSPVKSEQTSHTPATGSDSSSYKSMTNSRIFVFPQERPGFELVYPQTTMSVQPPAQSNAQPELSEEVPIRSSPTIQHPPSPYPEQASQNPFMHQQQELDRMMEAVNGMETAAMAAGEQPRSGSAAGPQPVHILPETLMSGAVNVASSAINTARSVINMIVPRENGTWVNGHWVSSAPDTPREANLRALAEMGFWDRDLNATLLARYNDDLPRVVTELVQ